MSQAVNARADGGIGERLSRLVVGELRELAGAIGERATSTVRDRVGGLTERLTEYAQGNGDPRTAAMAAGAKELAGGGSPFKAMLKGGAEGIKQAVRGKGGRTKKLKVTNIVEWADVGVPVRVAYNQWTEFEQFPSFTKKVEKVERAEDDTLTWRAQVFLSHRDWESHIIEQVPDERIIWKSKGAKGYVDGAVSFHALTPTLTRILLVLEYYPKGLFEHTGNIWRAQGRRARLEFKHFVRHTMTETARNPDDVEGWRGVIHDGEVVLDHDTAVRQEGEEGENKPRPKDSARRESASSGPRRRQSRTEPSGNGRGPSRGGRRD